MSEVKELTALNSKVLVFELGEDRYCVDIGEVAEIVGLEELTPIPNSPSQVEGVMDLRGVTTKIINPKRVLNVASQEKGDKIIVLDAETDDEGEERERVGWLVDEVYQVIDVTDENIDTSVDNRSIKGVIRREEGFIMWIDPEAVNG